MVFNKSEGKIYILQKYQVVIIPLNGQLQIFLAPHMFSMWFISNRPFEGFIKMQQHFKLYIYIIFLIKHNK